MILAGALAWLVLGARREDVPVAGVRSRPPTPPAASAPVAASVVRFRVVATGSVSFLIDAPLEKIKGHSTKLGGTIDLDVADLSKTHGEVDLDLDDLKTETFGESDKDAAQTEHAHNWLELGDGAKDRDANRWARFTFESIATVTPTKLADAPETNGARALKVLATGDMWLHGVSAMKTVPLTVIVNGPAGAPTSVRITTDAPIKVSLVEHDVKPRDLAGKFLNGALAKVGKKIDDTVQVSLDVSASREPAAGDAAR